MAQLERLSALDSTFLHQERDGSHMHIGGVCVFDGPCPTLEELLAVLEVRLAGLPRYRQKLMFGPLGPRWVDDPGFDLRFHVRAAALPSPAGEAELTAFVAQVAGQRLDRRRPLWEAWLVEAGPDRFALIFKSHHAMVDGVANFDLATVLLDLDAGGGAAGFRHGSPDAWLPRPAPGRLDLLAAEARDAVGTGLGLASRAVGAARRPSRTVREAVEVAQGLGGMAWEALNPAPVTPLQVDLGPHRRYAVVAHPLAELKAVRAAFGGTINDVVLTVASGALRRWLLSRSVDVSGLELRALVPVSVRSEQDQGALGNRLSVFRAPLPVWEADPVVTLGLIGEAMRELKESRQAVAASSLVSAAEVAPPAILARASRLQFSTRLFNLLVTNVPGPQFPLFLLGRRVSRMYPLPFLAEGHGLAMAIVSFDGTVSWGLLGDYDGLSDLAGVADGVRETLAELVTRAAGTAPADGAAQRRRREGRSLRVVADNTGPSDPAPRRPRAQPAATTRPPVPVRPPVVAPAPEPTEDPTLGPLVSPTGRRRSGPGSDMRARHRKT